MNYQELKNLNNNIEKLRSQVDALKYYLHLSKNVDKNTQLIKMVVADMDNLISSDFSKLEKKIKDSISEEDNKLRMEKLLKKHPKDVKAAENLARFMGIRKAIVNGAIKIQKAKLAEEVTKNGLKQIQQSSSKSGLGEKEPLR